MIRSVSTPLLILGFVVAMALSKVGVTALPLALYWLWTAAMIADLHEALPPDFYQTYEQGMRRVGEMIAATVALLAVNVLGDSLAWASGGWIEPFSERGSVARPVVFGLALWGLVAQFRVVRHVLSAVQTLERGRASEVSGGMTLINMLVSPLYIVFSHSNARKALGESGASGERDGASVEMA